MALDEEKIIAGLEKLAERIKYAKPWQWPREKQTSLEFRLWWTDLCNRKPHLRNVTNRKRGTK